MATGTSKKELQRIAIESLKAYGITSDSTLTVDTNYIGNVGTAHSRVFITCGQRIINITALVARASGYEPKERKSDGRWVIVTKGMGYSRAQHIADGLSWAMFGAGNFLNYDEI